MPPTSAFRPTRSDELALRSRAGPARPHSRGGAHAAGAVGGDNPFLPGRPRRHVGDERVAQRVRVGEREQRVMARSKPIEENGLPERPGRRPSRRSGSDRRRRNRAARAADARLACNRRAWPRASPATAGRVGRHRRSAANRRVKTSHGSSSPRRRSADHVRVVRGRVTRRRDRRHKRVPELDHRRRRRARHARTRRPLPLGDRRSHPSASTSAGSAETWSACTCVSNTAMIGAPIAAAAAR